jgi:DNA-binding transcriptional regulator GbsR (MarR family)
MGKRRAPKPSMRVKDGRTPPFVWFPNEVMRDYGAQIGPHAGWVYMALLTHANKEAVCWPAHETLATMTGMSLAQVKVSLKKLQRLGLISITMRRPKTSIYTVLDVPESIGNSQEVAITLDIIKVYRVAWPNAPRPSDGGDYAKR